MSQKFLNFLNSLKNQSNQSVIESIRTGYQVCFESSNEVTLTAYHGSYQNFDKFDLSRIGSARDMGYYSWGFYFTPNIRLAAYYAPIIYTVELHFNNPYITIAAGASDFLSKLDIHLKDYPYSSAEPMKIATEKIKSMGHDGVIIKDSTGSGHIREIVAYDPSQIKILKKEDLRSKSAKNIINESVSQGYKTIFEERRHYNKKFPEREEPINEEDVLTVYHGFNNLNDARITAKFGLSGKQRARRIYSYESGNNPSGLFVSIDFDAIKRGGFGNSSGVIIEFATKVKDLDAPVWAGGGSYFVQGQMTKSFKDMEERKQQQLDHREEGRKSKEKEISQSSRPELALSLFDNPERQALYIGDLNPNMIRAFWVNEKLMKESRHGGEWVRMSRDEFLRQYFKSEEDIKETASTFKGYEKQLPSRYIHAKERLFLPNEDYDESKLDERVKRLTDDQEFTKEKLIGDLKRGWIKLEDVFWPKQIKQFKEKYNL